MKHKRLMFGSLHRVMSRFRVPISLNTQNPIAGKSLKMIEELLQKPFGCAVVTELRFEKGC